MRTERDRRRGRVRWASLLGQNAFFFRKHADTPTEATAEDVLGRWTPHASSRSLRSFPSGRGGHSHAQWAPPGSGLLGVSQLFQPSTGVAVLAGVGGKHPTISPPGAPAGGVFLAHSISRKKCCSPLPLGDPSSWDTCWALQSQAPCSQAHRAGSSLSPYGSRATWAQCGRWSSLHPTRGTNSTLNCIFAVETRTHLSCRRVLGV